jgi:hypothetical protein
MANTPWTPQEDAVLRQRLPTLLERERCPREACRTLARLYLPRTWQGVRYRAVRLGLLPDNSSVRYYREEERQKRPRKKRRKS